MVLQHDGAAALFGAELAARHADRVQVLPPGIDLAALAPMRAARAARAEPRDGVFRLLQVGSLCARKNQDFLLDVLVALPPGLRARVRLDIAGPEREAGYAAALKARIAGAGFGDALRLLGWRNDAPALMVEADLLLLPSRDEGVSNTIQEAMAIGLPVIASDRGGSPRTLRPGVTGWVVPIGAAAPWAALIAELADDPEARARVARAAQAEADRAFGLDAWARRYHAVLRAAAGQAGGGPR